jgi:hypothetical protein
MADGMNDDLRLSNFVEDEIGIRLRRQAADGRIVRASADTRMKQKKINDGLNTGLNAPGGIVTLDPMFAA